MATSANSSPPPVASTQGNPAAGFTPTMTIHVDSGQDQKAPELVLSGRGRPTVSGDKSPGTGTPGVITTGATSHDAGMPGTDTSGTTAPGTGTPGASTSGTDTSGTTAPGTGTPGTSTTGATPH